MKYHLNDIALVPAVLSSISSRSEVNPLRNGKLPLFTAPMDMVIDENNAHYFYDNKLNVCLPRGLKTDNPNHFVSFGLDEIIDLVERKKELPKCILIDVANGHMKKLYDVAKKIKENYECSLMVGNIANPETYRMYAEFMGENDYIRCSIGSGISCITSSNTGVHYPMASLISEIYDIKKDNNYKLNIVADGGFRNFDEIIKTLAIGADYVMLGSILSKSFESCSSFYYKDYTGYKITNKEHAQKLFDDGQEVFKYYRGMSTKEVQKAWNKTNLKTSEGITKYNKVEHYLHKWVENMEDYLRSAMSYCDSRDLQQFKDNNQNVIILTEQSIKAYKK